MKILVDKINIRIKAFSFIDTYGGLIGSPNLRINQYLYENLTYPNFWGKRKYIKVKPTESELYNTLKPIFYSVWLYSKESFNPKYDGSELIISWFGNDYENDNIIDIIQTGVSNIDWNKNSVNFNY